MHTLEEIVANMRITECILSILVLAGLIVGSLYTMPAQSNAC